MMNSIQDIPFAQIPAFLKELEALDPDITTKFNMVSTKTGLPHHDVLEYLVLNDPVIWAYVYLDWTARDYQVPILRHGKTGKKLVLRLGRRLGKTESMCILILWHAFTQVNKGPNNQYNILIITPFEDQVNLIFERIKQLIDGSPQLKACATRDIHQQIELTIGNVTTIIRGMTAGSKSGNGAANTRGQRADLIILDEVDYMGTSEITNILNIRNEAPARIKIIVASTPSGKREEYYNWCTGASLMLHPPQSDIDNFCFTGYNEHRQKGNGWIEIYAPSIVNKELLEINPDTNQSYLEDLKEELTDMRFKQEVLAEFGEEEMGVYQKKYLDWAIEEGERINHRYTTEYSQDELQEFLNTPRSGPRILGVDWDKFGAATNMVCVELDKMYIDADGNLIPMFKVLFREEIARGEFTYTNAINKIIELDDIYKFDWIGVDRGAGETQIEVLRKYGMANPLTGMAEKVVPYSFSEKVEVRDPYTKKKDKKPMKPFMVNNSVVVFERNKMVLHPKDKKLFTQFEQYRVKSISSNGIPTYTDQNEHMVDCVNLALLLFEQKYGDLLRTVISTKIAYLPRLDLGSDKVKPRDIEKPKGNLVSFVNLGNKNGYIDARPTNRPRNTTAMPARRSF